MNVVFLSGGSGKRLWPLSNDTQSKQFLKLLKNERGEYESMVQRVMRQLISVQPNARVFVSSNATQADILRRHLGDVEMILEPTRRNTFPAIVLAAAYLYYISDLDENEVFIVCPIDAFAEVEYYVKLTELEYLVSTGRCEIGLLGADPTFPTEKYGYILQKNDRVIRFVEKPPENEAEQLISCGALWNCGVFALKIGYVLRCARKYIEFDSYESLCEQYSKLPGISFDYEVVEKETSINALTYNGVWKDIGTWSTLTEVMGDDSIGEYVHVSESCHNTHILNMLNIPIIAQDLADMVVVACHDGILVSSKRGTGTSYFRPLTEKINLRPMYEQRRWGDYRILEYKRSNNTSSIVKRLRVEAGKEISYQYHSRRCEAWVVISGKGILTIDGIDTVVAPGNVVSIPKLTKHSLLAATDMELIEVQLGSGELEEVKENIVSDLT